MAALVDTNVLVYRHDERDRRKQKIAVDLLRSGLADGSLHLSHQSIVEFVAATTRPLAGGPSILEAPDAWREAEELLLQFPTLMPSVAVLRTAIRGAATYQLSWFDAHQWAYAEHHAIPVILSEDFQTDRVYGTVRIVNPFA